ILARAREILGIGSAACVDVGSNLQEGSVITRRKRGVNVPIVADGVQRGRGGPCVHRAEKSVGTLALAASDLKTTKHNFHSKAAADVDDRKTLRSIVTEAGSKALIGSVLKIERDRLSLGLNYAKGKASNSCQSEDSFH